MCLCVYIYIYKNSNIYFKISINTHMHIYLFFLEKRITRNQKKRNNLWKKELNWSLGRKKRFERLNLTIERLNFSFHDFLALKLFES